MLFPPLRFVVMFGVTCARAHTSLLCICHYREPVLPAMPVRMARRARRQTIEEVVRIRLRELRASRGLTQEQLCESAGVSVDAVNRIESGTRVPTIATLASLATALGVEVGDLVRTEAMPPARFKPPVQRIVAQLASQPEEIQDAAEKLVRVLVSVARS